MLYPYQPRGSVRIVFKPIEFSGTGDNILVASSGARHRIQAYQLFLVASLATTLRFKSGATNLTGPVMLSALGSVTLDNIREPWFDTAEGEDLILNQTGAAVVGGVLGYFIIDCGLP